MITIKPASQLEKGDVFSTDGYKVTSAAQLVDGRVSVEVEESGNVKRALLAPDFPCPIWTGGFSTVPTDVWDLEPGDSYIVGTCGGVRESRTVLAILERKAMHGAILSVRDPRGDVFRSHMSGKVDRIEIN